MDPGVRLAGRPGAVRAGSAPTRPITTCEPGAAYPAVLLATAESDTRVDPMHARKMAARLQAATASDRPVLLRLEARAGHGAGKPLSKVLDELTDSWTFVFSELGVEV